MNQSNFINIAVIITISLFLTVKCIQHNCTAINSTQLALIENCFVHEEIINPHNYSYIHNGAKIACSNNKGKDIFLLVVVHSSAKNFKRRLAIRETWANRKRFPNVRVLFMLGFNENRTLIDLVKYESDAYGDIVQEDFIDAYKNITYKAIMAMKTVSEYCSNVKNLLKTDDDVVVNMYKYLRDINGTTLKNHTLKCFVFMGTKPIREIGNKWYIQIDEFPADDYGAYCSGPAYALSLDLPAKLYDKSLHTKFFWVDDYYLTGLLAHVLNVSYEDIGAMYMIYFDYKQTVLRDIYFVGVEPGFSPMPINLFYNVWKNITCFETNKCSDEYKPKLDRYFVHGIISNNKKKMHFIMALTISLLVWSVIISIFYYFCLHSRIRNYIEWNGYEI